MPPEGTDFVAIAAGGHHSLALKEDGSIVGWGDNYYGQAGPVTGSGFIAISAGAEHSLALKEDEGTGCQYFLAGDLDDDCVFDFHDFAIMMQNWLVDCNMDPDNPGCIPK